MLRTFVKLVNLLLSVQRFVKYTGYGNAAGLLAQRGLVGNRRLDVVYSSDSQDSDTEEYIELKDK